MQIQINNNLYLVEFSLEDISALVEIFNDEVVYQNTIHVPHPYAITDAEKWVNNILEMRNAGKPTHIFALRLDGKLIGSLGMHPKESPFAHQAEIGYTIGKANRNKGYMTSAIGALCKYSFESLNFRKIMATVFDGNIASEKALEKNGFALEGFVKEHIFKDNKYIDCKLYGKLRGW